MVGCGDFFSGVDVSYGVDDELLTFFVPGVLGCGETGMVDAGDGGEDAADGGGGAEWIGVRADDVREGGSLTGIIIVEGEIGALRFFGKSAE